MSEAAPPDLADVVDLCRAERFAEAEARCRAMLASAPDDGEAWHRLALICQRLGRPAEAIAYTEEAIRRLAAPGQAHHNLAVLLQTRGDLHAALPHYRQALASGLRDSRLHSNLGCLLRDLGQLRAGLDELEQAIAMDPTLADAHSNLGVTLCLQGRLDLALPHLRLATALRPDWDIGWSNLLLCLNYAHELPPATVAAAHLRYGQRLAGAAQPRARTPPIAGEPGRPLRVGLVSPDFRQHSVAYFLEPLLEARDPARVAYFAYANMVTHDAVAERLQRHCERWRSILGLPDDEAARLIQADGIDILIDLAGHTAHNRLSLFARRPAPVQMTYLGYPNTTGLAAIDWRITDAWADPSRLTEGLHSEQLLRLPGGFLCYRPGHDAPPPGPLPADSAGPITFATFNQLAKISPTALALWGRILAAVPGSRLVIKGPAFADADTRTTFAARLPQHGVPPDRVTLLPPVADAQEHLAAYHQVDIALDTTPYHGTTTTCEALWMGVPVITLAGAAHASRVGVSLLSRVGLADLVATSPDQYVELAVRLAADRSRLRQLRGQLRQQVTASGLTDGAGFARAFQDGLHQAWRQACARARASQAVAMPTGTTLLPMAGELRVAVADAPGQLTAYVLAEQHDWFEDEIHFVRAAVKRGEGAIDIGANHGVYALTLARAVGDEGRVWAFEPDPATAARLRLSLAANGFDQVTLSQSALADHSGPGNLSSDGHSELGHLVGQAAAGLAVNLETLDGAAARLPIGKVAFIKMDAEGAEPAIIAGARAFLARESPLVMFEVRHGAEIHRPTVDAMASAGFQLYALVPGLTLLAPVTELGGLDPYRLNLFGCQTDRAAALEAAGLLTRRLQRAPDAAPGSWAHHLRPMAVAQAIGATWRSPRTDREKTYFTALDHLALAHQPLDPPGQRLGHLMRAIELASSLLAAWPSIAVLQTVARLAAEAGYRAIAVQTLGTLIQRCADGVALDQDLPFVAACPRFDGVAPRDDDLRRWVLAAALEQRERLRAFSSFYTSRDPGTRATLETMAGLGYQSPEMARRLTLVKRLLA